MRPEIVLELLAARGWSLATCESLTGGLVAAALTSVPGSSRVIRGGLVTYATDLKSSLAGVEMDVIEDRGVVSSAVALAMAQGARDRCGSDVGVATTGVAGPGPVGSDRAGTVWVAVSWPGGVRAQRALVDGDRATVRSAAVDLALALVVSCVDPSVDR